MRYLCLLTDDPAVPNPELGSAEFQEMMDGYRAATAAMAEGGVLVDSAPLQPPSTARSLRMRNGKSVVTDGPFMEAKEIVGGYMIVTADSYEHALEMAREMYGMMSPGTRIEIREMAAY